MADPLPSLRRHALAAFLAVALFLVALGGWAGTTEIAGAVVAQGTLVPLDGTKKVQHPEGGVVTEILVEDGDAVTAGQLLVRLDGTAVAANLAVIVSQLSGAFALQARLAAESTGSDRLTLPPTAFAYQWQRCNPNGRVCVPIPGATASGYTPVAEDAGHALVAVVGAVRANVTQNAYSTASRPIAPSRRLRVSARISGTSP